MATPASTNLNRILRVTANLLFEKGENPQNVANLLRGFVNPSMVREWHERYCSVNGVDKSENRSRAIKRMPMPPIDWQAVSIKTLDEMLEPVSEPSQEPEW